MYKSRYKTPADFDDLILVSDGEMLTGLHFANEKSFRPTALVSPQKLVTHSSTDDLPVFQQTRNWLDSYFSGQAPSFVPKYKLCRMTPFQQMIQTSLLRIPYGRLTTYGTIATEIAKTRGLQKMSARAVGGAVGRNPIAIIFPCHRVIGADGKPTGYSGGLKNKVALLRHEGVDLNFAKT